jgi:hypothetical protein
MLMVVSVSSLIAARPEPQVQIDTFFKTLNAKGASAAISELSNGTLLGTQKGSQLEAFAPQLDAALKIYGKVSRIESVDKKSFGESFVRFRMISYQASGTPLFWEFMFFRNKDEWQIYIFQFNDQFPRVFGDTG